jgi:C4-type Zn-finger protein
MTTASRVIGICVTIGRRGGEILADHPIKDDVAEVEIICAHCGYRMTRTAARLRRPHHIDCPACGKTIVPGSDRRDDDTSAH